ncbi:MAG: sigma-70 family RNA polymerase sigma factor [Bacteroidaceae bacterium]
MTSLQLTVSEERELIEELQGQNTQKKAFERVVKMYSEPLYWQIRRMVSLHSDADDILQNTFLKAWMHLDQFRAESKISTWLYRIAYNESVTFIKKYGNNIESSDNTMELANQIESDAYFDGDEMSVLFQAAVESLPAKQRMVFNLKYYDEMKYSQISDVLGTTIGTLKASYHQAVKKIRLFLDKQE